MGWPACGEVCWTLEADVRRKMGLCFFPADLTHVKPITGQNQAVQTSSSWQQTVFCLCASSGGEKSIGTPENISLVGLLVGSYFCNEVASEQNEPIFKMPGLFSPLDTRGTQLSVLSTTQIPALICVVTLSKTPIPCLQWWQLQW